MGSPTVTPLVEARHDGGFIVTEANGHRSRDGGTIKSGENLSAGAVLGKITKGAITVTRTNVSGAGKGALTLASPAYGTGVKAGLYKVVFVEPATDAGTFAVEDPDGVIVGTGTVGVAFDGVVKFTIADGATDFVAGDTALVTVTVAAGSGKYIAYDPTATDGSETAVAILYGASYAATADQKATLIVRDAEVNASELVWDASVDDQTKKNTALAALATLGIIAR